MKQVDTAWYLRIDRSQAADRAVLVGDRGRALLAADELDDAEIVNEDRGLTTVLGSWSGTPITVTAFGMGAPIAAICLHELAALGTTRFVRAGTMMTVGATPLGSWVVPNEALVHDSTSRSYGVIDERVAADRELVAAATAVLGTEAHVSGLVASCDGFYTEMTDALGAPTVAHDRRRHWDEAGVVAVDMETAAVFAVAAALGVAAAAVNLASVSGGADERMAPERRAAAERRLLHLAFETLTTDRRGDP